MWGRGTSCKFEWSFWTFSYTPTLGRVTHIGQPFPNHLNVANIRRNDCRPTIWYTVLLLKVGLALPPIVNRVAKIIQHYKGDSDDLRGRISILLATGKYTECFKKPYLDLLFNLSDWADLRSSFISLDFFYCFFVDLIFLHVCCFGKTEILRSHVLTCDIQDIFLT